VTSLEAERDATESRQNDSGGREGLAGDGTMAAYPLAHLGPPAGGGPLDALERVVEADAEAAGSRMNEEETYPVTRRGAISRFTRSAQSAAGLNKEKGREGGGCSQSTLPLAKRDLYFPLATYVNRTRDWLSVMRYFERSLTCRES